MMRIKQAASEFLAKKRIAVTGVSRQPKEHGRPCMFEPTADFGHKAMRVVFTLSGNVPREV